MKKYLFLAIVALATLVSCQKELLDNGMSESKHIVFSASIAQDDTKATLDDSSNPAKIKWEATDKITITDGSGNVAVYKLTEGAGETSATFEYESGTTLATGSTYSAVFGIDPSFPQLYGSTSIPIHMVAPSTDDNTKLSFTADCGVLRLTLTDADDDVTRVEVVGSTQDYVLNCASPVSITSATSFYLVLPAGTYSAIKVYNNTGKVATKSKTITITTNHLLPATSSKLDFEVGTKGITDGHAWVQLWAEGPKWAEFNVGATIIDYFHLFTGTSGDDATLTNYDPLYCTENCGGLYDWRNSENNARVSGTLAGSNKHDVSATLWGGDWRDPSIEELEGLKTYCSKTWCDGSTTQYYGSVLTGYKVTGPLGNSVFFPACGYWYGYDGYKYIGKIKDRTRMWSSTKNQGDNPSMFTYSETESEYGSGTQDPAGFALTVRAVYDPTSAQPDGALTGVFSVGPKATDKVLFSKGNLTCDISGATPEWKFYEHQYDCAEDGFASSTLISLFTWGYDATHSIDPDGTDYVTGHTTDMDKQLSKSEDWGCVFGGESSVWRTLSAAEWEYLFDTRTMTNGKDRYSNNTSGVTIGGTTYCGVFIYPDNYNEAAVSSSMSWDDINAAGIVFLPAAGWRNGTTVRDPGFGKYWSSSADGESYGSSVFFNNGIVISSQYANRTDGYSVRLVTDVPAE